MVAPLDASAQGRALVLAERIIAEVRAHVGRTREELESALSAIDAEARDRKLKAGLVKLVLDRCELDGADAEGAPELRRGLFSMAAARRRSLGPGERFDRAAVVADFARDREVDPAELERRLYADLRAAQELRGFEPVTA